MNFKKVLAAMLATSVLFSCGNSQSNAKDGKDSEITTILLDEGSGIDDKSFHAAAWRGITTFYGDTPDHPSKKDLYYKEIFSATQDLRLPNAKLASDEQPDLIIATGYTFAEAINEAAKLFPHQKYLLIDDNSITQPNVKTATFAEYEGSYLIGVAAAQKAIEDGITNPKFGFVGGMKGSVITRFEIGYVQGILSVLPNAVIEDYYANDWGKPELGKLTAKAWYDNGVYCIFVAAGGTGNGVIAQAKEYRQAGKNVWVIGVDSDQYADGLYAEGQSAVLTSMIKKVEAPVIDTLNAVKENNFEAGHTVYDLSMGGLDYSKSNTMLTESVINKMEEAKNNIINKETIVYGTFAEAVEAKAVPSTLKAVD